MTVQGAVAKRGRGKIYSCMIRGGLNRALGRVEPVEIPIEEFAKRRIVIFSDHHRGIGDGADDFKACESTYCAALGWYLEQEYEIWLIGDVDELWENKPEGVFEHYSDVINLEREFLNGPGYVRLFGNHDMTWRRGWFARILGRLSLYERLMKKRVGTDTQEGIHIELTQDGKLNGRLFVTHGHQGTLDSGNLIILPFARFFVRQVWARLQRGKGFRANTPSSDIDVRHKHDCAMYEWAEGRSREDTPTVLIAGHTHHPVFPGQPPPDLKAKKREAEAGLVGARDQVPRDPGVVAAARALYEQAVAKVRRDDYEQVDQDKPCYFNTGCCSFSDADVTGIEIVDGELRLVRWLNDDARSESGPKHLTAGPHLKLADAFDQIENS